MKVRYIKKNKLVMTNEEKVRKIVDSIFSTGFNTHRTFYEMAYDSAIRMAEWKDQQMIEYLYKNIQSLLKDYGVSEASADMATQLFLANFKQAMEE